MIRAAMAVVMLVALAALGGCLQYERDEMASSSTLSQLPTERLIDSYASARVLGRMDETIFNELSTRLDWSDEDLADIKEGTVRVGFSKDQLRLARGTPHNVSTSASAFSSSELWHYRGRRHDVFRLHDGRVVSWTTFENN